MSPVLRGRDTTGYLSHPFFTASLVAHLKGDSLPPTFTAKYHYAVSRLNAIAWGPTKDAVVFLRRTMVGISLMEALAYPWEGLIELPVSDDSRVPALLAYAVAADSDSGFAASADLACTAHFIRRTWCKAYGGDSSGCAVYAIDDIALGESRTDSVRVVVPCPGTRYPQSAVLMLRRLTGDVFEGINCGAGIKPIVDGLVEGTSRTPREMMQSLREAAKAGGAKRRR